ncbi:serine/threonine-protein kinase/endoribonuclease ire-1-like [Neocloeon triangulifer]|uniref:serine/threonine-protein kinase/endoribonuclease ire-1-like n=1 Tax=Neocloeon triangulifer TaxID=2078957 RepID=UPI00286F05FC|nr:serine/threonine-protein kinase/endoribonuclease ire-1-like [Neocloeon triangulifer]
MQLLPRSVKGHLETDLTLTAIISQSDSSTVYRGTLKVGSELLQVAIKSASNLSAGWRECEVLRLIGCHPSVVHLLQPVTSDGGEFFQVMELCDSSLAQMPALEENVFKVFVQDFIQAVKTLHQKMKFVHGALSLDHLLLNQDQRLKVCSFSKTEVCQNVNLLKKDLQDMAVSILEAPSKERFGDLSPETAFENPRFLVDNLARKSTLSRNDSILLVSLAYPLLTGLTLAQNLENHVFLQSPENVLRFIDGCKDFLMSRSCPMAESRLESTSYSVVGPNWVSQGHLDTMREGRRYDGSMKDLLRLIRNKTEHYCSVPGYIRQCLAHPLVDPGSFLGYFTALFPGLIPWTWHCMFEFRVEANLQAFYPEDGQYLTRVPIQQMIGR